MSGKVATKERKVHVGRTLGETSKEWLLVSSVKPQLNIVLTSYNVCDVDGCGSWVEPASCYRKVAGSIRLVYMSKCPWARYWNPNCLNLTRKWTYDEGPVCLSLAHWHTVCRSGSEWIAQVWGCVELGWCCTLGILTSPSVSQLVWLNNRWANISVSSACTTLMKCSDRSPRLPDALYTKREAQRLD